MSEFDCKKFARQMRENAVKDYNGNIICSPELWEKIASIVERQPQTAEWIKVSERLPDRNQGYILVWDLEEFAVFNTKSLDKWSWETYARFFENNEVEFWLPIPPPPPEAEK